MIKRVRAEEPNGMLQIKMLLLQAKNILTNGKLLCRAPMQEDKNVVTN